MFSGQTPAVGWQKSDGSLRPSVNSQSSQIQPSEMYFGFIRCWEDHQSEFEHIFDGEIADHKGNLVENLIYCMVFELIQH